MRSGSEECFSFQHIQPPFALHGISMKLACALAHCCPELACPELALYIAVVALAKAAVLGAAPKSNGIV